MSIPLWAWIVGGGAALYFFTRGASGQPINPVCAYGGNNADFSTVAAFAAKIGATSVAVVATGVWSMQYQDAPAILRAPDVTYQGSSASGWSLITAKDGTTVGGATLDSLIEAINAFA